MTNNDETSLPQQTVTVLLVEDDPADQVLVQWAFTYSKQPYLLNIANDGDEALDYVWRRGRFADPGSSPRPDIILLDINMPRVEGMTVLETLKDSEEFCSIPVVMLTTSANEADRELSKALGARCFWTKPTSRDEYIELVHVVNFHLVQRKL